MSKIHPLSCVDKKAKIGKNVTIEPFATVKENVILKDNVTIKSYAYIDGFTTIGENTTIYPSASIGTKTQDLKYKGERTFIQIGKNCEIREFVTINSSCGENTKVTIGDSSLIMAYCHIAHNCSIGKNVIMANSAMLAGHVIVEDFVTIGGMTPIHQFSKIGRFSMVGGFSRVSKDVAPFTIGGGDPYKLGGLNHVGLQRRNVPLEVRNELAKAFKITFRENLHLKEALDKIDKELKPLEEIKHWISFCQSSKRGLLGLEGITQKKSDEESSQNLSIVK
jgi:UDP-N-acetylglucosamine acyltransferase